MFHTLLKTIVSWINGHKIGDVRYIQALPFIIGDPVHLLPSSCWTYEERNQLRYCVDKYKWNGLNWEYASHLELPLEEFCKLKNVFCHDEGRRYLYDS